MYNILDFKNFPSIIGNGIIIDENTLFFKSYSTKYEPLIINRPSFFGEIDNAMKYLTSNKKLGIFSTNKKLKLLDIRYISQIINNLILLRENNDFDTIIKGYMTLALSFGLVSLYNQLNLYKMRYSTILKNDHRYKKMIEYYNNNENKSVNNKELFLNPIELQGIRIGEVNNDVESTFILKQIFENYFDGFISPNIQSPYFDENFIPNEILLFNPINCLTKINNLPNNSITLNINSLLVKNNINLFSVPYFMNKNTNTFFQYGGNIKNSIDYIFEKNNLINSLYEINNKKNIKFMNKLKKQGKIFKKNMLNNNTFISFNKNKNDYMFNRNNMINTIKK